MRCRRVLTNESHDPVHKLMPSLETPKQLTRFSWPTSEPTFSPRVTSHTYMLVRFAPAAKMRWEAYLALEVIVAGEQQSAGDGGGDGGDAAEDGVVLEE